MSAPIATGEKRPREESATTAVTDPTDATVPVHSRHKRHSRFDGREMPKEFGEALGEYQDPDEAKDIEEIVMGHVEFDDLPEKKKTALYTGVKMLAQKLGNDPAKQAAMTEKDMDVAYRKASQLKGVGEVARKSELTAAYRHLVRAGEVEENRKLEEILIKKKGKSHSGVLVVTVFMGPGQFSCPKDCHYCPNQPGVARSYLLKEPGVLRGYRNAWDPIRQFYDRASALENNGHVVDKIELIILGGTFSFYPKDYAEEFIAASFYAANTYFASPPFRAMGSIAEEITLNETARCRIIGVTAETRPDYISLTELKRFRYLGVTRIQLGIQHLDDRVLEVINRECPTEKTVEAIKKCLDAGFKVDAHWMPDLPGSSYAQDKEMFENLLGPDNIHFQVDQWKVYPTATVPFTKIKEWYENGTYKPYAEENNGQNMVDLLVYIMANTPYRIRLNRIIRDIPTSYIMAGEKRVNLRQVIEQHMKKNNIRCKDIRERECKGESIRKDQSKLFIDEFTASGAQELYISIENMDRTSLYGHLRLRLRPQSAQGQNIFPTLEGCALIRELHTYGRLVAVDRVNTGREAQHVGVGTQLMRKAESIALERGYRKVAVIAGVGVRLYYAKLGYRLEDTYMVKDLVPVDDGVATATVVTAGIIPEVLEDLDDDNDQPVGGFMGKFKSFFSS